MPEELPDTREWTDGPMPTHELAMRMNWPRCPVCGSVLYVGLSPRAVYCSNACKCKAYRERRRTR